MNKGERTRELILNRGMLHSSRYGLVDISIGTIAKLCNLSRTGVISHFQNKDDMQIAILDYSEQQFRNQVIKPSKHDDALTQLKTMIDLWVNWTNRIFEQQGTSCPFIKALVDYEHRADSPVRRHAVEQQQQLLKFVTYLVSTGQKQQRIVNDIPAHDIASELYSLYIGQSVLLALENTHHRSNEIRNQLNRALQRYSVN